MKEYKRLTGADDYDCEIDFCWGCQYFGETHWCENPSGECSNYTRFCEMYCRLAELEDKIENGTLAECPTPRQRTARERVEEELEELCIKHYNLVMFIENNFNFKKLNHVEQDCLLRQEEYMKEYIDILKYRLSIWRDRG